MNEIKNKHVFLLLNLKIEVSCDVLKEICLEIDNILNISITEILS